MTEVEFERINRLPINVLRLDPLNPRLPEEIQGRSQEELAKFIVRTYQPLSVATSIAEHGYFESEPLIAVPEKDGTFTVVEGNRRLTAIKGLAEPELRAQFTSKQAWEAAAAQADLPADFPVLVVEDRASVAPIIGYRHISGIEPWEPFAKARFIASLVDNSNLSFTEVAGLVGETKGDVAADYRNYAILRQAREDLGLETWQVEEKFGVFDNAMGYVQLRAHIGAPDPGAVDPASKPIPSDRTHELSELLVWIFGDADEQGRVIQDSRELRLLSTVVASPVGLEALRNEGDLATAIEAVDDAVGGARKKLISRLTAFRNGMRLAVESLEGVDPDDKIETLLEECQEALTALREAFDELDPPAAEDA